MAPLRGTLRGSYNSYFNQFIRAPLASSSTNRSRSKWNREINGYLRYSVVKMLTDSTVLSFRAKRGISRGCEILRFAKNKYFPPSNKKTALSKRFVNNKKIDANFRFLYLNIVGLYTSISYFIYYAIQFIRK